MAPVKPLSSNLPSLLIEGEDNPRFSITNVDMEELRIDQNGCSVDQLSLEELEKVQTKILMKMNG